MGLLPPAPKAGASAISPSRRSPIVQDILLLQINLRIYRIVYNLLNTERLLRPVREI